jgi:hypothetical protein
VKHHAPESQESEAEFTKLSIPGIPTNQLLRKRTEEDEEMVVFEWNVTGKGDY